MHQVQLYKIQIKKCHKLLIIRAGAMVRPVHAVRVFEGGKMHGVARILTYACVMALPAVRRSLGRLNCDEAFLGVFFFFFFLVFKRPK